MLIKTCSNYHELVNYHVRNKIPVADHCIPQSNAFFYFENKSNKYWNPFKYSLTTQMFDTIDTSKYDTIVFYDNGGLLHPALFVEKYRVNPSVKKIIIMMEPNEIYKNIIDVSKNDFITMVKKKYPNINVIFEDNIPNFILTTVGKNVYAQRCLSIYLDYNHIYITANADSHHCIIGFEKMNMCQKTAGWMFKDEIKAHACYDKNKVVKSYSDDLYFVILLLVISFINIALNLVAGFKRNDYVSYFIAYFAYENYMNERKYLTTNTMISLCNK